VRLLIPLGQFGMPIYFFSKFALPHEIPSFVTLIRIDNLFFQKLIKSMRFLIPLRFIRNDNLFFQNLLHPMRFLIPLRFIRNDKRLLKNGVVMAVRSANRHHYPCSLICTVIPSESEGSQSHMSLFFNFFYSCR